MQVSCSTNPKRKLPYTWELIEVYDNAPTWVGVNTAMPNQVTKLLLEQRLLPSLQIYDTLRSEVAYGQEKSRIDFLLTGDSILPTYVEVKSTTWLKGECALFPDTVTTRGQKHIRELKAMLPEARVCMLYFINRGGLYGLFAWRYRRPALWKASARSCGRRARGFSLSL